MWYKKRMAPEGVKVYNPAFDFADNELIAGIVTEYGMVNLKGLSTWERAEALIGIAHPQFREELIQSAEQMHIWRKSNKR